MKTVHSAAPHDPRGNRLWTKRFVFVCVAGVILLASFMALIPALPLYVKRIGGSDAEVGLIVGIATVSSVVGRLFCGQAVERWGCKRLAVGGASAFLVTALLYGVAHSVPALIVVRLLHGFAAAVATTSANVLVVNIAPLKRRGEAISYFTMTGNVATALAPALSAWLLTQQLGWDGFTLVFTTTALLAAVAVVALLMVSDAPPENPSPAVVRNSSWTANPLAIAVLPASITLMMLSVPYATITAFLPVYAGAGNIAMFFFTYATATLLSRPGAGLAIDRLGPRVVAVPGAAMVAVGVSLLALSPQLSTMLPAALIYGLGWGITYPSLMAMALERAKARQRGAAMGTFLASFDVGVALGAMLGGVVASATGYALTFLMAGAFATLGVIYCVAYPRLTKIADTTIDENDEVVSEFPD